MIFGLIRFRTAAAILAVANATSSPGLAQDVGVEPASGGAFDLHVQFTEGEPVLVTTSFRADGSIEFDGKGAPPKIKVSGRGKRKLVDTYTKLTENTSVSERLVLQWNEDEQGEIADPPLTGATARYENDGSRAEVILLEDRSIRIDTLNELLLHESCIGLWLSLESAAVGEPVFTDLTSMSCFLLGLESSPTQQETDLHLDSVSDTHIARISGTHLFTTDLSDGDMELKARFEGDVVIDVDVQAHKLVQISWKGTTKGEGSLGGTALHMDARTIAEAKAKVIDAKTAPKPTKPRDNVHQIAGGVGTFALPSTWFRSGELKDGSVAYIDGERGISDTICATTILNLPTNESKEAMEVAEKKVLETSSATKFKTAKSKLGKGRVTTFVQGDRTVIFELIATKTSLLRIRSESPNDFASHVEQVHKKVRSSLRPAK